MYLVDFSSMQDSISVIQTNNRSAHFFNGNQYGKIHQKLYDKVVKDSIKEAKANIREQKRLERIMKLGRIG